MICTAISEKDYSNALEQAKIAEMAEIRLDMTDFSDDQIKEIFACETPLIATCRPRRITEDHRKEILILAIKSGALYIDVEIESSKEFIKEIIELAHAHKCEVIISYHNFELTPSQKELEKIVNECFDLGADVAKLACQVNKTSDNARILGLLGTGKRMVTIGMGEVGKITRVISPFLGAEFTFASPDDDMGTAPGQISETEMNKVINELKEL